MTPITAPTAPATTSTIHSRALLVWLTIRTWSARKYDRKVSSDVNASFAADANASRTNKFLLPADNDAYKTLTALAASVRQWHYENTLPWADDGWRVLPTANYTVYMDGLRERQTTFRATLASFLTAYPSMQAAAPRLLGKMYHADDYPTLGDLRSRFDLSIAVNPLPTYGDVRVDLDAKHIADLEQQIQTRVTDATKIAMMDAWERLQTVVARAKEKLTDPDAIFRNSLIDNITDVCDVLTRLNVTDDTDLERMRARVKRELTNIDPDVLRDNKRYRSDTAAKADAILSAMSSYLK